MVGHQMVYRLIGFHGYGPYNTDHAPENWQHMRMIADDKHPMERWLYDEATLRGWKMVRYGFTTLDQFHRWWPAESAELTWLVQRGYLLHQFCVPQKHVICSMRQCVYCPRHAIPIGTLCPRLDCKDATICRIPNLPRM